MPWRVNKYHTILAQIIDVLTCSFCIAASYLFWNILIRVFPHLPLGSQFQLVFTHFILFLIADIICFISFKFQKVYSSQRFTSYSTEIIIILRTALFLAFCLSSSMFIFRISYIPRSLLLIFLTLFVLIFCVEKLLLFQIAKIIRRKGKDRKQVLLVGESIRLQNFIKAIQRNRSWGLDIIGVVIVDKNKVKNEFLKNNNLGNINDLEKILHVSLVDDVIITISSSKFDLIRHVIECCEREGIRVHLVSDFLGHVVKHIQADFIYGFPIITMSMTHEKYFQLAFKRIFDILISFILITLLIPLFIIIGILIRVTSKGSIFYEWNVVGLNKRPFKSWKFRTMIVDADKLKKSLIDKNEMKGPVFKMKDDPRVTKIGRFLRKYSLDELPQLFSVLKGDMSLVGPRPVFLHELKKYDNWHRRKLSIKPGITCLWQVNGRNDISNFDEWVKLDLFYIDNWSILLDLKILLKTIPTVLMGKGAS